MSRDESTREIERILNTTVGPYLRELEQKRERAQRKARAEVNKRLRNRDAIPEPRPSKPLPGQMSLFGSAQDERDE